MAAKKAAKSSADRMRAYRERLRSQGIIEYTVKLRPAQIKKLERLAKRQGVSVTSIIERWVDEMRD
jgi:hypothetical protein